MKRFFFFIVSLLLSVSAFAQSGNNEPLKGDVNGDGTVDVADIAAVIEIMKNGGGTGEQTTYYWYVGKSSPTSIGGEGWTSLGTDLSGVTYIQVDTSNDPDYNLPTFYVVLPTSLNFKPYNADGSKNESALWTSSTWSINNAYTLWERGNRTTEINTRFKK